MEPTPTDSRSNQTTGEDETPANADTNMRSDEPRQSNTKPTGGQAGPRPDAGSEQAQTKAQGVAALFEKDELKGLFLRYLGAMFVLEAFIFFVSFLSQLGPETVPFPWKSYFFAAFTIPLTITFLLGIIVVSFDRYIFGHQHHGSEFKNFFQSASETRSRIHKLHASLYVIRQFPFLLGLLTLLAVSVAAYKLNDILAVVGHVGERTAYYLLIALAVALAVAVVVGLIWMFLSYNLRKKTLEYQFQYKKDVIDKTGLILIGEDRVMNRDGRVLSFNNIQELSGRSGSDEELKPMIIDQS